LKKSIPTGLGCEIQTSFIIYFSSVNQIYFKYMELIWVASTLQITYLLFENLNSPVVGAEPSEKG